MKASVVGVAILMLAATAFADIVSWRDEDGVQHFTNLVEEVPAEYRDGTHIVVNERTRHAASLLSNDTLAPPVRVSEEPRREAEAIYGRSDVASAYVAGVRRGLEVAGGGAGLQINSPLAVVTTREDTDRRGPVPLYAYGYLPPEWYPFVTTSFDRGRSRHLTLRMLLQDQFELDRAAPYVYVERLPPFGYVPIGPNLNAFMPRGLPPYSVPATTRVIVR